MYIPTNIHLVVLELNIFVNDPGRLFLLASPWSLETALAISGSFLWLWLNDICEHPSEVEGLKQEERPETKPAFWLCWIFSAQLLELCWKEARPHLNKCRRSNFALCQKGSYNIYKNVKYISMTVSNMFLDFLHNADLEEGDLVEGTLDNIKSNLSLI